MYSLPQLSLNSSPLSSQGQGSWFGGVSPVEQQQQRQFGGQGTGGQGTSKQEQMQQTPWQVQLPVISEARRGSKTSSHIDGIYELSGDGVRR